MTDSALLARVPLFSQLTEADLATLAGRLKRRRIPSGTFLFLREDLGTAFYIVERGLVAISLSSPDGKERELARLGPGDYFGELALLDGAPRSADAATVEESELLLLEREAFLAFLRQHPDAAIALLVHLAALLRGNLETIQDATFQDVPGRLARALLRLADEHAGGDRGTPVVEGITQIDLARQVGTTRESVNKWLGSFEKRGLIARERGRIRLLRPAGLEWHLVRG